MAATAGVGIDRSRITRFGKEGQSNVLVAKFDSTGKQIWSTVIGGETGIELPSAIAVDPRGNVYVAGATLAIDFPTTPGTVKETAAEGGRLGFVCKLDPTGKNLIYSTLIEAEQSIESVVSAMVVDSQGQVILAGSAAVAQDSLPWAERRPFDEIGFLAKLDASGRSYVFRRSLSGSGFTAILALAQRSDGTIAFGGHTFARDIPLVNPIQREFRSGNLYRSSGGAWQNLPQPNGVSAMAWSPDGKYLYAGGLNSVSRSADGGDSWQNSSLVGEDDARQGFPNPVAGIGFDPSSPAHVFAAVDREGVFESLDAGETWRRYGPARALLFRGLVVAGGSPFAVFATTRSSTEVLLNGVWNATSPFTGSWRILAVEPKTRAVFAEGNRFGVRGLYRSSNDAGVWTRVGDMRNHSQLVIDPEDSAILYGGTGSQVERSSDGGATWSPFHDGLPESGAVLLAFDSTNGSIHASTYEGVYHRQRDTAWEPVPGGPANTWLDGISVDPTGKRGIVGYAADTSDAFVGRLSSDGSEVQSLTYLGGASSDSVRALAFDGNGDLWAAGDTQSKDLPLTAGAFATERRGIRGTFVVKIDPRRDMLAYSSYAGPTVAGTAIPLAINPRNGDVVLGPRGLTILRPDGTVTLGLADAVPGALSFAPEGTLTVLDFLTNRLVRLPFGNP